MSGRPRFGLIIVPPPPSFQMPWVAGSRAVLAKVKVRFRHQQLPRAVEFDRLLRQLLGLPPLVCVSFARACTRRAASALSSSERGPIQG